jgi:hypothetical protein
MTKKNMDKKNYMDIEKDYNLQIDKLRKLIPEIPPIIIPTQAL